MNILDFKRKALGYTFRGESDSVDYTPPARLVVAKPNPETSRAKIAAALGVPVSSVEPQYGTMMGGRDDNTPVTDYDNVTGYAVKQSESLGLKFDAAGNPAGQYVPQTAQDPFAQIGDSLGDVAKLALAGAAVYFGVTAVANLISSIGAAAAAEVVGATGITAGTAATIAPEVLTATAAELTTATAAATGAATAGGLAAGELGLAGGTALGAGNLATAGALGGATGAAGSGFTFAGLLKNPGGTLGNALGITDPTLAKLAGNTIIETAKNGGDIESAIKNTAISYGLNIAGSTVSTAVKDALKDIPQSELSDSVKAGITRGVTGAAVATLQGRDPMQALVGSASSTALNELVKQIPGYSDNTLSPEAKKIANDAVKAALTGKDITSATLNAALNEGIRAAAGYADTALGLGSSTATSSTPGAANPMSQDPAQRAASTTSTAANTTTGSTTLDDVESTLAANGLQNTGGTGFDAVNQLAGNAGNLTTDLSAGDVAAITGNTGEVQAGVVTAGIPTGTVTDAGPRGGNPLQNLRAGETAGATQKIESGYEVTEVYGTTADGEPYSYAVTYNPNASSGNNYEYTWFTPLASGGYQLNTSGSLPNFDSEATGSGVNTSADTSSNDLTDDQIEEIITGGQTNLGNTTSQEILDALNDATIPGSAGADTSSNDLTDEQIQEIITGGQTNLGDTTSQEILDALNDADTNDTTQSGGVFTTGIKGDRGDRGATGATGLTGATGERGEQGLMGLTGATGEQGIAGERGETGERGERGEAGASQSPEEIRAIVDAALAANPNLTEAQVTTAINAAIANIPAGISTADVSNAINTAIANIPAGISTADVTNIVTDATRNLATQTDVNNAIANIQFPAGISKADVAEQITTALAANPNLTASDVAQSISDYMTANPGITAADVGSIVANATQGLATTGSVEALQADLTKAINDANSNNALAFDAIDQAIADLKAAGLTEQQVQTIVDTSAGNVTQAFRDALNAAVTGNNTALDALQTTLSESIAATETKLTDAIAANEAAGLTRDQATQKAIDDVAGQLGTTKADLLVQLGTTEAALTTKLTTGLAELDTRLTDAEQRLSDAIQAAKDIGLKGDAALQASLDSVASELGLTKQELLSQLGTTEANLKTQFETGLAGVATKVEDINKSLTDAIAVNEAAGLTRDQATQKAIDDVAGQLNTTKADLLTQLDTTEAALTKKLTTGLESVTTKVDEINTSLTAAIAANEAAGLTRDQATTKAIDDVATQLGTTKADLLTQLGTTEAALTTRLTTELAAVTTKVEEINTSLTAAIAANEAAGLTRDQATQKAIDDVAGQLGTTKADLLTQLGTTEAALTTKLTTGLAEVETKLTETEQRLSDAIQAAKDIGLEGDAALQAGIDSVAAELGIAKSELLTQLGKTENDLRDEFQTGLGVVTTDIAKTRTDLLDAIAANQADGLTRDEATQKAIDDLAGQLGTTKVDLLAQLGTTEAELGAQIAGVQTNLTNQLTAQGQQFMDALVAQGMDQATALQTAIDAQNELITTGQTATQTALAALSAAQQQEVADRVAAGETTDAAIAAVQLAVDTGQAATQAALNALSTAQQQEVADRVAAGETTNAAIAAVQAAVTEGQTDTNRRIDDLMKQGLTQYEATQQAILELSTGFTDQLTAAEFARQTDRDTAEAARQADIAAAAEQRLADQQAATTAAAEAEKARQTEITNQKARETANLKTIQTGQLRGQMQSGLQGLIGGLQQQATQMAAPAQVETVKSTPGFDFSSPLNTGFFSGYESQKVSPKDKESLKIATGGYLDDLLEAIR